MRSTDHECSIIGDVGGRGGRGGRVARIVAAKLNQPGHQLGRADEAVPMAVPFEEGQAKAAQTTWAMSLARSGPVETNSIGMELVFIPPGSFTMGSPPTVKGRSKHENQVEVTLTSPFYLGKTEVTQGQWEAVMGTTPWLRKRYVREGDNFPATFVSWDDAQAFCKKLSEKEKEAYRLPTEAEWEFACRGGTTTQFSFGDEGILSDYAWWGGLYGEGNATGELYAHEVGRKEPNPFGLRDMHGNVFEWCADVYSDNLPGGIDPLVSTGGWYRVNRGGGWYRRAVNCRSASRSDCRSRSFRNFDVGFRVARNASQLVPD